MKKYIYFIKDITEYIVVKLFIILLNIFPLKTSRKVGSVLFLFLGRLSNNHSTALQNCKTVFPKLEQDQINKIVNKSWENLGKTIFELARLKNLFKDNKLIKIKGKEKIDNIIRNNIPSIFFSIHNSNWEICVPYLDNLGIATGAIYRHINNRFLDKFIFQKRTAALVSQKSFYTPKGEKSARDIIKGIKKNKSVFLLVDQKDSAGEQINLFGKNVKTQIGFLKIARKYNMPIIPMQNKRLKNDKFEITFHNPLYNKNTSKTDREMMLEIHKIIEEWIKNNPTQWFWQHNRFN